MTQALVLRRMGVSALLVAGAIFVGCGDSTSQDPFDDPAVRRSNSGPDATTGGSDGSRPPPGPDFEDASADGRTPGAGDGSLFNDATPDVTTDACVVGDAGPPPRPQRCVAATLNECDPTTDTQLTAFGVNAALLNVKAGAGAQGNGFDDDCDGMVDEGCKCEGNGQTKDCYLLPPTQADSVTRKPVGWCEANAKGSLDCAGTEFAKWSGTCRGAQPPYRHDVCAPGDFNCDGVSSNSDVQDCACKVDPVQCPTAPIVLAPYPNTTNIPRIDGSAWITDPGQRAASTNWTWTAVGGDCDNVLPYPTFVFYNQANSTNGQRRGARTPVKFDPNATPPRYVSSAGEPLVAIQAPNYGNGVAGGQVYTAFGLSGDYIVQGEWDMGGQHYVCTQKVEVRAPGIRAELCWDTVGGDVASTGNDIDLHFARLKGLTCANPGWGDDCAQAPTYADCWYDARSGCRDGSPTPPGWGYADSADSACLGWSSKRRGPILGIGQRCTNPRLDKDNVTCDRAQPDPTNLGFCGPENINVDNPNNGDKFVVGLTHYANHGGTSDAKPHVNIYCNGKRVLSAGYNPATGQTGFPLLKNAGADSTGDIWTVATVSATVTGGQLTSCAVETVPSHVVDPTRDGTAATGSTGNGVCVDSATSSPAPAGKFRYTNQRFVENTPLQPSASGIPTTAAAWCKH